MKKITAAVMAGAMVLGLTACGAKETDPMDTFAENTIAETTTEATTTTTDPLGHHWARKVPVIDFNSNINRKHILA